MSEAAGAGAAVSESTLAAAFGGKRVLLTGHTGFKGGWLTLWLSRLGAEVTGYALAPDTQPALFEALALERSCRRHVLGDIRDGRALTEVVRTTAPDFVFHLAAQPLVRRSYAEPVATFETNVMGTVNLLEAIRTTGVRCSIVVVTTDKCYENREWVYGYREDDALGGHDPYAASKAATEIVVSSYRRSYFAPNRLAEHGVALASARAGNVVGGGDWALDRIVPDAARALVEGRPLAVRNPSAIRPWQHVLEPLSGYLHLGRKLAEGTPEQRARFCEAWNFGPQPESARPVRDVVEGLIAAWGSGTWQDQSDPHAPHEGAVLRLSIDKAVAQLGWLPRWDLAQTLSRTADWYKAFYRNPPTDVLRALTVRQIDDYMAGGRA